MVYFLSCLKRVRQRFKASSQCGGLMPNVSLIFVLLSTLYAGRWAAVGYPLVGIGLTLHSKPFISMMAEAKSYQEA